LKTGRDGGSGVAAVDLYTHRTTAFGGVESTFEDAEYVVLGVPFDFTSTYRPGSRFAPAAIREASWNLEGYSLRSGIDAERLAVHDLGDLDVLGDVRGTLHRLRRVVNEIVSRAKVPVVLGGEHTVTYGCLDAFDDDVAVLCFDAHLDLRDEYIGRKLSHATFMRRICERIGGDRVFHVGVRAVSPNELDFAETTGVDYVTARDLTGDWRGVLATLTDRLRPFDRVYLTLDLDVVDPAYAPAVGNPVPEGLSPTLLLDVLEPLCDARVVGVDVVEVAPTYDTGGTPVLAAHLVYNVLTFLAQSKGKG
jgi:agmatinase